MSFSTALSCEMLAGHLNDPAWRIVDCRHQLTDAAYGERVYAEGHLPGAFFMHLDRDLSGPMNGKNGRHPLPDVDIVSARLGELGITPQTQVVVYDDAGGMVAGRLWWLLRWLGHDKVALLDGGIAQWLKEARPLVHDVPPPPQPVRFSAAKRDWLVGSDAVLENLKGGNLCVIDARAPDRFRGENETLDPVGGHIPGARNRFFRDNLDADGLFKSAGELRSEWLALMSGVPPDQLVMQCGSGVSACLNLIALEIAGLSGAKLYAGSWSEWCSDPARPVAK